MTTSILIALVVMDELQYDQFHSNLSRIHLLMKNQRTNDGISTGMSTAGPMAQALRTEFPEFNTQQDWPDLMTSKWS